MVNVSMGDPTQDRQRRAGLASFSGGNRMYWLRRENGRGWENGAMNQFEVWKRPSTPPSSHSTTLSLVLRVSTPLADDLVSVDVMRRPHHISSLVLWSSNLRASSPRPSPRSFPSPLLEAVEDKTARCTPLSVPGSLVTRPRQFRRPALSRAPSWRDIPRLSADLGRETMEKGSTPFV